MGAGESTSVKRTTEGTSATPHSVQSESGNDDDSEVDELTQSTLDLHISDTQNTGPKRKNIQSKEEAEERNVKQRIEKEKTAPAPAAGFGAFAIPTPSADESQKFAEWVVTKRRMIHERVAAKGGMEYIDQNLLSSHADMCEWLLEETMATVSDKALYTGEVIIDNRITISIKPDIKQWAETLITVCLKHEDENGELVRTLIGSFSVLKKSQIRFMECVKGDVGWIVRRKNGHGNQFVVFPEEKSYWGPAGFASETQLNLFAFPEQVIHGLFNLSEIEKRYYISTWRYTGHISIGIHDTEKKEYNLFDSSGESMSTLRSLSIDVLYKSYAIKGQVNSWSINNVNLQTTAEDIHCQTYVWYFVFCVVARGEDPVIFSQRMNLKSPSCRVSILRAFRLLMKNTLRGLHTVGALAQLKTVEEAKNDQDCILPNVDLVMKRMKQLNKKPESDALPPPPLVKATTVEINGNGPSFLFGPDNTSFNFDLNKTEPTGPKRKAVQTEDINEEKLKHQKTQGGCISVESLLLSAKVAEQQRMSSVGASAGALASSAVPPFKQIGQGGNGCVFYPVNVPGHTKPLVLNMKPKHTVAHEKFIASEIRKRWNFSIPLEDFFILPLDIKVNLSTTELQNLKCNVGSEKEQFDFFYSEFGGPTLSHEKSNKYRNSLAGTIVLYQIMMALMYLSNIGIAHEDVHSGNICIDPVTNHPRLIDWSESAELFNRMESDTMIYDSPPGSTYYLDNALKESYLQRLPEEDNESDVGPIISLLEDYLKKNGRDDVIIPPPSKTRLSSVGASAGALAEVPIPTTTTVIPSSQHKTDIKYVSVSTAKRIGSGSNGCAFYPVDIPERSKAVVLIMKNIRTATAEWNLSNVMRQRWNFSIPIEDFFILVLPYKPNLSPIDRQTLKCNVAVEDRSFYYSDYGGVTVATQLDKYKHSLHGVILYYTILMYNVYLQNIGIRHSDLQQHYGNILVDPVDNKIRLIDWSQGGTSEGGRVISDSVIFDEQPDFGEFLPNDIHPNGIQGFAKFWNEQVKITYHYLTPSMRIKRLDVQHVITLLEAYLKSKDRADVIIPPPSKTRLGSSAAAAGAGAGAGATATSPSAATPTPPPQHKTGEPKRSRKH